MVQGKPICFSPFLNVRALSIGMSFCLAAFALFASCLFAFSTTGVGIHCVPGVCLSNDAVCDAPE